MLDHKNRMMGKKVENKIKSRYEKSDDPFWAHEHPDSKNIHETNSQSKQNSNKSQISMRKSPPKKISSEKFHSKKISAEESHPKIQAPEKNDAIDGLRSLIRVENYNFHQLKNRVFLNCWILAKHLIFGRNFDVWSKF